MESINNPTHFEIKKAAKALKDGHLVAFPTETVYGLGADASNEKAVSRIYSVKGRPADHPLIVHISSINQLEKWVVDIQEYVLNLATDYWPGPMTLILKRSSLAKNFITGSQDSVGVRVPAHPVALALLYEFEKIKGVGVVAPSANRFGAVSPTTTSAVREELSAYLSVTDQILEGGQCLIGIESTIIDCTSLIPKILRPGSVTIEMINNSSKVGGITVNNKSDIRSPGLLESHYSPKAKVVLDQTSEIGDGFLALASVPTPIGAIRIASPLNIEEFAKMLYDAFRLADNQGLNKIVVISPLGGGLAEAIRDRLNKSSSLI